MRRWRWAIAAIVIGIAVCRIVAPSGRTTGGIGDVVANGRFTMRVDEVRWLTEAGDPEREAREGYKWLAISGGWRFSPNLLGPDLDWASMRVRDDTGAEYLPAPDLGAEFLDVHPWPLGRNADMGIKGAVAFEVPTTATGLRFEMAGVSVRLN